MLYDSAAAWIAAEEKRIMLFGMSGLGKTYISNLLRAGGGWFHYSVDYRIGTRYMGEHIADNFKREAMKVPLLRDLLMSDSVYISSNITFENLDPLSTYLGKPGNPDMGGLSWAEYTHRQELHRAAEVSAMRDAGHFAHRAQEIYGYSNFICDASGSVCEVVDPDDPKDPVMSAVAAAVLPVWIEGSDDHTQELVRRFDRAPKPMCYNEDFLAKAWSDYRAETGLNETDIDPDAFIRWAFARALAHRQPRYAKMAERWGVKVAADAIASVRTEADMIGLIADALEARH